jgi:hypothetical protein
MIIMSNNKVVEKVKELMAAPTCCAELKTVAQEYLAAVGTANEKAAGKKLVAELEEDVASIDGLVGFLNSEHAVQVMGKDAAASMLAQAKKVKAAGGKYCFCPACTAGKAILDMKAEL